MTAMPFHWVWQALLACLAAGLVFSALVGLALLLRPRTMMRASQRWSRWVDTGGWFTRLDHILWDLEPRLYHHHRLLGAALAAAAAYVLWQWAFAYDREQALRVLAPQLVARNLDWLVAGIEWCIVLVQAAAFLLGAIIFVRPSLLKGFERSANQWHEPAALAALLDRQNFAADRWLNLHPRLLGFVVLCASAFSLLALAWPLRLALG